jgi:hypothetical protein
MAALVPRNVTRIDIRVVVGPGVNGCRIDPVPAATTDDTASSTSTAP